MQWCRKIYVISERVIFELDRNNRNSRDSKQFVSHRQMDPAKEGTKQLHEINIENKVECMKRIADIANQSLDMSKLTHQENITATKISNNDLSWDANFAKLVEYVGENFRLPSQVEGPTTVTGKQKLGMWCSNERNKSHTTARGDRMQGMKAITSILYNCWSPNWNEPQTDSGTPQFGILTNPYPNRYEESPFRYGDCFFGVFFSHAHDRPFLTKN
jgi:hypothetical protein